MPLSPASVDRAVESSALWARSFAINLLALAACRFLLSSFEVHGVWGYALAAVGIELPTLIWWLTVRLWQAVAFSNFGEGIVVASRVGSIALVGIPLILLVFVVPLGLLTSLPGLLVSEWISPLMISGIWTYVAACAITTGLTLAFRQSRPLRFMSRFLKANADDGSQLAETH